MNHNTTQAEVLPPERRQVGRPAKVLSLVPTRSSHERAATINKYHSLSRAAAQDAVSFAVMAGMELAAAKASLPHGSFMNWVEKNCEFGQTTATKYLLLADRMLEAKGLKAAVAELPGGQIQTAGDRKMLLEMIRETADGATLQQLYLDFGILKPKATPGPKGGAREGAGRPSSADFSDLRKTAIRQDYAEVFRSLTDMIVAKQTWKYLDVKDLVEFDERLKMYRETLKPAISAATAR